MSWKARLVPGGVLLGILVAWGSTVQATNSVGERNIAVRLQGDHQGIVPIEWQGSLEGVVIRYRVTLEEDARLQARLVRRESSSSPWNPAPDIVNLADELALEIHAEKTCDPYQASVVLTLSPVGDPDDIMTRNRDLDSLTWRFGVQVPASPSLCGTVWTGTLLGGFLGFVLGVYLTYLFSRVHLLTRRQLESKFAFQKDPGRRVGVTVVGGSGRRWIWCCFRPSFWLGKKYQEAATLTLSSHPPSVIARILPPDRQKQVDDPGSVGPLGGLFARGRASGVELIAQVGNRGQVGRYTLERGGRQVTTQDEVVSLRRGDRLRSREEHSADDNREIVWRIT